MWTNIQLTMHVVILFQDLVLPNSIPLAGVHLGVWREQVSNHHLSQLSGRKRTGSDDLPNLVKWNIYAM